MASTEPHPIPLTESEVLIRGFLAANPDLDASLGSIEIMTDRYTNEEWAGQIEETRKVVLKEVESGQRGRKVYEGPRMKDGKDALKELALTVDHTVLKLDANTAAIDTLCSEARTEGFKVSSNLSDFLFVLRFCYSKVTTRLDIWKETSQLTKPFTSVRLRSPQLGPTLHIQSQRLLRRRSLRRRLPRGHPGHLLQTTRSTRCRCGRRCRTRCRP